MKTAATAKIVTPVLIEELLRKATENPRKRAHYNLHDSLEDLIQRLCIATRLGTYFRPHRHTPPATWELFVVLRGAAAFLIFDDIESGKVTNRIDIHAAGNGSPLAEIPQDCWHTLVITQDKTVLLEIKQGPYHPLKETNFASWAPPEGTPKSKDFEKKLRKAIAGDYIFLSKKTQ